MWPMVATPEVAQRTAPGWRRASAISSAKPRPAKAGVPTTSTGVRITLATGTKARSGS
ncbi:hypothetical protein D3C71_765470 [compost metagenome]